MKEVIVQAGDKTKLSLDVDVIKLLCIPSSRGKSHGVVGNGMQTSKVWKAFHEAQETQEGDMGMVWKAHTSLDIMNQAKKSYIYYVCSVCQRKDREWYL